MLKPPPQAATTLRDGTAVRLRAIRPDDKERLRIAFERLSPETVYRRFFHPVAALTTDELRNLTELDSGEHVGLALSVDESTGERLIAVGRFIRVARHSDRVEFAITVADDYQRRGAATLLMQELVRTARSLGVRELIGDVLEDNREMLQFVRSLGLPCRQSFADGVCHVVLNVGEH